MKSTLSLSVVALFAVGCAREAPPPTAPAPTGPFPADYAWPPRVLGQAEPPAASSVMARVPVTPTPAARSEAPPPAPAAPTSAIPGGEACLAKLRELGIRHRPLDARRGVVTPIVVEGPIGGIEYTAGAGLPFESDCRLAVALHDVGPVLAELGIEKLRFSGVYTYRMSRTGRLSLHAYGLAIDVHAAFAHGLWHSVDKDYKAGLANGCAEDAPLLNRARCKLEAMGIFKELITPDHNADHRDHLHLAIAPAKSEA